MQNGSDPEATIREKAGVKHRGHAANTVEAVGEHGSVITDYRYEQNTYSDSQFLKDSIENAPEQEEERILIADGACGGKENRDLAAAKNIRLVTTGINGGRDTPLADFEFSEDGTQALKCPAGHKPNRCSHCKKAGQCQLSFDREQCANCPRKEDAQGKNLQKGEQG